VATKKPKKSVPKKVKPEMVYTALPKRAPRPKPIKKPPKKRPHAKHVATKAEKRRQKRIINHALAGLVGLLLFVGGLYIITGIFKLERIFDESLRQADVINQIDEKAVKNARIAGSDGELQQQVVNFQSAPADLQKYVIADYRKFKNSCIVNDQISPDVGYQVVAVVYDSFAKVARTCGGTTSALIKKFDSGWVEVFNGNVPPTCSLVNDLAIPKGLSEICIEQGIQYTNPNP
jgi:hypothetical protein